MCRNRILTFTPEVLALSLPALTDTAPAADPNMRRRAFAMLIMDTVAGLTLNFDRHIRRCDHVCRIGSTLTKALTTGISASFCLTPADLNIPLRTEAVVVIQAAGYRTI